MTSSWQKFEELISERHNMFLLSLIIRKGGNMGKVIEVTDQSFEDEVLGAGTKALR